MINYLEKFLFIILILVVSGSKSSPRKWFTDTNISATNERRTKLSELIYTHPEILSKENNAINVDDISSGTDSGITFLSNDAYSNSNSQNSMPSPLPSCKSSTFCENALNYPNDLVKAVLRMNKNLKLMSGTDLINNDIKHRLNTSPEDTSLCESYEKIVYPKVAQSKNKEWLFIINQEDFTQGVRVETCSNQNSACNLIEGFAEGYKTTCKQKYIYRQLIALTSDGKVKPKMFRFPASCCCHIKFTGSSLFRIGAGSNKRDKIPTSKMQTK